MICNAVYFNAGSTSYTAGIVSLLLTHKIINAILFFKFQFNFLKYFK